jgi:hypothetical protein
MFTQAFWISLRILIFRAGPQDFPFDTGRRLIAACAGFALLANAVTFLFVATPAEAIVSALLNIGLMALLTWLTLSSMKLQNRFQQTFNALAVTTSILTLLMLPLLAKVVPVWMTVMDRLAKNPELMSHPEDLPEVQAISTASFWLLLVLLWQLLVTAYIFFKAAGRKALLVLIVLFIALMVARALIGAPG